MAHKDSFTAFLGKTGQYLNAKTLADKWELLTAAQKKDAAALKRAFNWPIAICIQQVLFFGNTVEKERKLFPWAFNGAEN